MENVANCKHGENLPSVLRVFDQMSKRTPSEVANLKTMTNLAKIVIANLAKIREEFGQKFDEIAR